MLGFNTPTMIEGAFQSFENTVAPDNHIIKMFFELGYPLPNSIEETREKNCELASKYGWLIIPIPNHSVTENHNVAIFDHCRIRDEDFYITYDPDVRMQQRGWIPAMVEALRSDENTVFVTANRRYRDLEWCWKGHGRTIQTLPSGLRVGRYRDLVAWSMGMYKGSWLKNYMGREFKARNPVYGYGEHAMVDLMLKHGKTWCEVSDFYDDHLSSEVVYSEWKTESAGHKTQLKFEDWLKARSPQGK